MDIFTDKKLIIGSMLSVAILLAVLLTAGYIKLPFYEAQVGGPGSCLVLEEKYCETARLYTIDAAGTEAAALNLPHGTTIYMPFDGAYFDDSFGDGGFTKMRLGIPESAAFLIVQGEYEPVAQEGMKLVKGDVVATTVENDYKENDQTGFNIVIYGENYDLTGLFE